MKTPFTFLIGIGAYVSSVLGTNLGLYTTKNLCMDARMSPRWQLQNGLPAQAYTCANSDNQQITFRQDHLVAFGKDQYFCLDLTNGRWTPGTQFQYHQCSTGNPNQQWVYQPNGMIQSVAHPEFCVDVKDGLYENGNVFQAWWCDANNKNQIFSYGGKIGYSDTGVSGSVSQSGGSGSGNNDWVKKLFPVKRLLSWAEDDRYYNKLNVGTKIVALAHWEHGDVAGNNKLWLPQFWGDRKWNEWNQRKAEIKASGKVPPVVLSFNECDLAVGQNSQASAGMDPYWAAQVHKKEIEDVFRPMGSKIIGPQWGSIWNEDYINKFMGECQKLGCKFDGMGLHHYETMKDGVDAAVKNTIAQVEKAYERFNLPLFITELGFASSGGGTDQQFIEYLQKIGKYLDNTDKVAVWSLSAVQRKNNGGWGNDNGFMSSSFAFFNSDYSVTDLGYKYMYDTF